MAKEETEEMTEEERTVSWEEYVRSEMNAILDLYLDDAIAGNVGIRYGHPEIGTMEDGSKMFDESKINVVAVTMVLRLGDTVDSPK